MDEWTDIPLDLSALQRLLDNIAPKWYVANLPAATIEPAPSMTTALCYALLIDEDHLCLQVKCLFLEPDMRTAEVIDVWLQKHGYSHKCYLSWISTYGSKIDGLFFWIASLTCEQHINLIYANGIWSMRRSGILNLMDPSIAITIGGYLVAMSEVGDKLKKKDESIQNSFTDPRLEAGAFVLSLAVLNQPVKDLQSRCDEIGLVPFGELALLHVLIAEFARTPQETYRETLVAWL